MKYFILLICFSSLTIIAHGQMEIRPFMGVNFSDITDSPDGTSTSAKVGWQFGGHLLIGKRFHLYPGIQYYQTTTELVSNDVDIENIEQRLGGVKIPILVGYRFIDPESDPFLNVRVFAGPSISFLTKSEYSENLLDDEFDWNSSLWAAQLGLGLDVSIFFIDVSYEFGLSDAHSTSEGFETFKDVRNNTFLFNLGLRLKLAT